LHTQCPRCQTIFRINATHLNIAQGQVRCSRCRHVFNANDFLVKELPKKEKTPQPVTTQTELNENTEDFSEELLESEFPELLKEDYSDRGRSWKSLFFWLLASLIFMGFLFSQYLWFAHRDLVLQNAQVRPWLERFCNVFLCTLPTTSDLNQFEMQEQSIRIDSSTTPHIMQVNAIFINRASFPQPYPVLQLTFQDTNGKPIAQRRFQPTEYLRLAYITEEIKPQMPIHIKLELVDIEVPVADGGVVKGYVFDFF